MASKRRFCPRTSDKNHVPLSEPPREKWIGVDFLPPPGTGDCMGGQHESRVYRWQERETEADTELQPLAHGDDMIQAGSRTRRSHPRRSPDPGTQTWDRTTPPGPARTEHVRSR